MRELQDLQDTLGLSDFPCGSTKNLRELVQFWGRFGRRSELLNQMKEVTRRVNSAAHGAGVRVTGVASCLQCNSLEASRRFGPSGGCPSVQANEFPGFRYELFGLT
ncbi:hypothetical protein D9M68_724810 [compost metagenome]